MSGDDATASAAMPLGRRMAEVADLVTVALDELCGPRATARNRCLIF